MFACMTLFQCLLDLTHNRPNINGIANIAYQVDNPAVVYRDYPEDFDTTNKTLDFGMEEFEQRFVATLFDSQNRLVKTREIFCLPTDDGFSYTQNRDVYESGLLNTISSLSTSPSIFLLALKTILEFLLQMIIQIS